MSDKLDELIDKNSLKILQETIDNLIEQDKTNYSKKIHNIKISIIKNIIKLFDSPLMQLGEIEEDTIINEINNKELIYYLIEKYYFDTQLFYEELCSFLYVYLQIQNDNINTNKAIIITNNELKKIKGVNYGKKKALQNKSTKKRSTKKV